MPFTPLPYLPLFGLVEIPTHGLFFLLGALICLGLARRRLSRDDFQKLHNAIPAMVLGSLIGARAFFLFSRPDVWSTPSRWLQFWDGGMVSYGGILGALWALYKCWAHGEFGLLLDRLAPCFLVAIAVGRLGCFLSWYGEEGTPSDLPWALEVNGVSRHPVMLYASLLLLLGALALWHLSPTAEKKLALLSALYYGLVRAFCDQWRDYQPEYLLNFSRLICLLIVAVSLFHLVALERVPRQSVESDFRKK